MEEKSGETSEQADPGKGEQYAEDDTILGVQKVWEQEQDHDCQFEELEKDEFTARIEDEKPCTSWMWSMDCMIIWLSAMIMRHDDHAGG